MAKPKTKLESAAILTIKDAPNMTPLGRQEIAAWLRRQARMLIKDGENYTFGRFRATYYHK